MGSIHFGDDSGKDCLIGALIVADFAFQPT